MPVRILDGCGCKECSNTRKRTQDEFIEAANSVYSGFYSYDKCNYDGVGNKIIVTCPIHGDFTVKANNHLNGHGCRKCKEEGFMHDFNPREKREGTTKKLTQETFIKRIEEKYGSKYGLENVRYVNYSTKVILECKEHRMF